MKTEMTPDAQKDLFVFLGLFLAFNCFCIFSAFFAESYWMFSHKLDLRALILYRSLLQTLTVLLGSFFAIYSMYHGVLVERIIKWGIPILIIVTILILATTPLKNDLHGSISCCGEGRSPTKWGYPYGWVTCPGEYSDFCGIANNRLQLSYFFTDEFDLGYLFVNYWLGINLTFFIFGAFEDLFKILQKVVYRRNNKNHFL